MKCNHLKPISREAALPALAIIYAPEKEWSPFWLEVSELLGLDEIKDSLIY